MKWVKVDENICGATHISASASYGSNQKRFEQLNAMNAAIHAHKLELGSRKVQCEKSDVQCLLEKKHHKSSSPYSAQLLVLGHE